MRYILGFDTAMMGCSAALYDAAEKKSWARRTPMLRGQSEALVPMVQDVLAEAGRGFADIDLLAVTVGPGAFTGLRLALSAARAWGLSLDRPVAGVTTLEVLAAMLYGGTDGPPARILIETKRDDFYTQLYDVHGRAAGAAEALSFADIQARRDAPGTVHIGDAVERYAALCAEKPVIRTGFELPDPAVIAQAGLRKFQAGLPDGMPQPLYLRGADVTASKRVQRRIAEE
jgi:tRNA threonylcarbamoyladenosine biosynthesis protein TsaB